MTTISSADQTYMQKLCTQSFPSSQRSREIVLKVYYITLGHALYNQQLFVNPTRDMILFSSLQEMWILFETTDWNNGLTDAEY